MSTSSNNDHQQQPEKITPSLCPLCNQSNHCANVSACGSSQPCWCSEQTIAFPQTLLNKVPSDAKNKACICKACALKHNVS